MAENVIFHLQNKFYSRPVLWGFQDKYEEFQINYHVTGVLIRYDAALSVKSETIMPDCYSRVIGLGAS